jgi:hypothetical protein
MTALLHRRYGLAHGERAQQRYIAKCKACGTVTSGVTSGQNPRRYKEDPQRTGDLYTYAQPKGEPAQATPGSIVLDCRGCGRPRYAKLVRGIYNPEVACSPRCMSATGTTCECSCAGKNHGGAYGGG